jgi:peptidylprolyl isomerase
VLALVVVVASCGVSGPQDDRAESTTTRQKRVDDTAGAGVDEHWHAAFAISVCGTFLDPLEDQGEDRNGIHTHSDGLIHVHPFTAAAAGPEATLAIFFDQVGLEVDGDRLTINGNDVSTRKCDGEPKLRLAVWNSASDTEAFEPEILSDDLGSVVITDNSALTLALEPDDVEVEPPPAAPDICELGHLDGDNVDDADGECAPTPSTGPDGSDPESVEGQPCATEAAQAGSGAPQAKMPGGVPPEEVEIEEITLGDGAEAVAGTRAVVDYVGFACSSGQVFASSWKMGEPFAFDLGAGGVVPGFDKGVTGMRVGGRRQVVIPPAFGYGDAGSPPAIGPGETLIFVLDLRRVE